MSSLAIRLPEMIGLTILHSLWQITLLWIVLVAVLRLWPRASSSARYTLAILTLMLSVLATTATAVYEWQSNATSEEVSALSDGTVQAIHTAYITVKQTVSSRIIDGLNTSLPVLAWLWCAGLVVMGTRFAGSFFYLGTLRAKDNIGAIAPVWEQKLKSLSSDLGLRCKVDIATSTRISSPLRWAASLLLSFFQPDFYQDCLPRRSNPYWFMNFTISNGATTSSIFVRH
jgi:bla regulator protein blaR1